MFSEVLANVVGCSPTDPLGEVGREDLYKLLDYGDYDEENRGGGQTVQWTAFLRLVNEIPNDLGQDKLEAQSGEQQDTQRDDKRKLREHVPPEQAAILPCLDGYCRFSECGGKVHGRGDCAVRFTTCLQIISRHPYKAKDYPVTWDMGW